MNAEPAHSDDFLSSCVRQPVLHSRGVWVGGLVITSLVAVSLSGGQRIPLHSEAAVTEVIPPEVAVWADVPCDVPRQQWLINRPLPSASLGDWLLIISATTKAPLDDGAAEEAEAVSPWERTPVKVARRVVIASTGSEGALQGVTSGERTLRWQPVTPPMGRSAGARKSAKTLSVMESLSDRTDKRIPQEYAEAGIRRKIRALPSGHRSENTTEGLIELRVVAENRRCRAWAPLHESKDDGYLSFAERAITLLEEVCLPKVEADQGPWPDVDGDGVLNVVISKEVSEAGGQVWAYVRPGDICSEDPAFPPWDVLYLSPEAALPQLPPILVHELTHLAQFSWSRHRNVGVVYSLPDWLTEGLAHAAELRAEVSWSNTAPRLRAFLEQPHTCPLVVVDAAGSGYWRHPGQRGASAAFCDWYLRYTPGWSWDQLLIPFATSETPWRDVTTRNFSELYRAWTIELATSGMPGAATQASLFPHLRDLSEEEEIDVELHGTATSYFRLSRRGVKRDSSLMQQAERDFRDEIIVQSGCNRPLQVTLIRLP